MKRDDIIRMGVEAGLLEPGHPVGERVLGEMTRFVQLATEQERAARQAAQIENEDLKARLARAGIEQRRAVAKEREACAKASESQIDRWVDDRARYAASECAAAIRARGQA